MEDRTVVNFTTKPGTKAVSQSQSESPPTQPPLPHTPPLLLPMPLCPLLQPDSLPATSPNHLRLYGVNATLLRKCVAGRAPLYHALSQMAPTQPAARRAMYKWVA